MNSFTKDKLLSHKRYKVLILALCFYGLIATHLFNNLKLSFFIIIIVLSILLLVSKLGGISFQYYLFRGLYLYIASILFFIFLSILVSLKITVGASENFNAVAAAIPKVFGNTIILVLTMIPNSLAASVLAYVIQSKTRHA